MTRDAMRRILSSVVIGAATLLVVPAFAQQQTDIPGPAGSTSFGTKVAVLSNSNIVVTASNAVYLYTHDGVLINTLASGTALELADGDIVVNASGANYLYDATGALLNTLSGGTLKVLANGNLLVTGASTADLYGPTGTFLNTLAGANVTELPNHNLVDVGSAVYLYTSSGTLVSTLSGSVAGDNIGSGGIVVLANGNFVVVSPAWNTSRGAVTWVDGGAGLTATVSASNSLVGSQVGDGIGFGGVKALSNGNYVVISQYWTNVAVSDAVQ